MFISVGGGLGILLILVVAAVMSDNPWVKLASVVYVGIYAITLIVSMFIKGFDPWSVIMLVVMVVLAMYAYGVHHMFDPKDKK